MTEPKTTITEVLATPACIEARRALEVTCRDAEMGRKIAGLALSLAEGRGPELTEPTRSHLLGDFDMVKEVEKLSKVLDQISDEACEAFRCSLGEHGATKPDG